MYACIITEKNSAVIYFVQFINHLKIWNIHYQTECAELLQVEVHLFQVIFLQVDTEICCFYIMSTWVSNIWTRVFRDCSSFSFQALFSDDLLTSCGGRCTSRRLLFVSDFPYFQEFIFITLLLRSCRSQHFGLPRAINTGACAYFKPQEG